MTRSLAVSSANSLLLALLNRDGPDVKQRLLAKAPQPYESGASSMAGTLRRVKGGFRRMLETELGEEQWCGSCREFWPLDAEFFNASKDSLAYECKACLIERRRATAGSLKLQQVDLGAGK